MKNRIAAPLAALAAIAGLATAEIPIGQPFTLAPDEKVLVGDLPLELHFETIAEDSRCPLDAVCIWEGEAVAELRLSSPDRDAENVRLHTRHSPFGPSVVEHADLFVHLLDVMPYPKSTIPIDPADYRLTLIVLESATRVPTASTSWTTFKARF